MLQIGLCFALCMNYVKLLNNFICNNSLPYCVQSEKTTSVYLIGDEPGVVSWLLGERSSLAELSNEWPLLGKRTPRSDNDPSWTLMGKPDQEVTKAGER